MSSCTWVLIPRCFGVTQQLIVGILVYFRNCTCSDGTVTQTTVSKSVLGSDIVHYAAVSKSAAHESVISASQR